MDKQDKMKALDLMIVLGGKPKGDEEGYGKMNKGGKMRCPKCGTECEPMEDMEEEEDDDME